MSQKDDMTDFPQNLSQKRMSREEIIKAVTEGRVDSGLEKKTVVISTSAAVKADFDKIAQKLDLKSGSDPYKILKVFCEDKRATVETAKVLAARIRGLSEEQLKIMKLVVGREEFTQKSILDFVQSMKKMGNERILTLHAFVELDGSGPGPLYQFFNTVLPRVNPAEAGGQAYMEELKEKKMTPDQVTFFYNICNRIANIEPGTAIALLPKIRQLKKQHTQFLNAFLKKDATFGKRPIDNYSILGLINLWLSLPELSDRKRVPRLIKRLSRKSGKKSKDFKYLTHCFRIELENEKGVSLGNLASRIRSFFS